jgi:hypothetical protein
MIVEIRGGSGLRRAMRDYARLCADPESGAYNRVSGASIIREGLDAAPVLWDLLTRLVEAPHPVSAMDIARAMRDVRGQSNITTGLWTLANYELVTRTWENHRRRLGGGRWLYTLSPLGRLVMGQKGTDTDGLEKDAGQLSH